MSLSKRRSQEKSNDPNNMEKSDPDISDRKPLDQVNTQVRCYWYGGRRVEDENKQSHKIHEMTQSEQNSGSTFLPLLEGSGVWGLSSIFRVWTRMSGEILVPAKIPVGKLLPFWAWKWLEQYDPIRSVTAYLQNYRSSCSGSVCFFNQNIIITEPWMMRASKKSNNCGSVMNPLNSGLSCW